MSNIVELETRLDIGIFMFSVTRLSLFHLEILD